jgi:hypothetical protein
MLLEVTLSRPTPSGDPSPCVRDLLRIGVGRGRPRSWPRGHQIPSLDWDPHALWMEESVSNGACSKFSDL